MNNRTEFLQNCIVLDTETTSLNFREAEVIELGYGIYVNDKWELFDKLYCPANGDVSHEISSVTHITQKMVQSKPFFGKSINEDLNPVLEMIEKNGNVVAHNAFYDMNVLANYPMHKLVNPWLCTLRMSRKLYANDPTVTRFNLPYLRYRFELDIPEAMAHHRADSDAFMTGKLLEFLVDEMISQDIITVDSPLREQIEDWLIAPITITTFPFGKHKGKKLEDIPLSYYKWALVNLDSLNEDKDEFDADFASSVVKAIETMI